MTSDHAASSRRRGALFATLARVYAELAELETSGASPRPIPVVRPTQKLSKAELAAALCRSPATIDRWVLAGMPCEEMGTYRLFDLTICKAWAASRPKPGRPVRGTAPPAAQRANDNEGGEPYLVRRRSRA